MTLKRQTLWAQYVLSFWVSFVTIRQKLTKMPFANRAFVLVPTIENGRKETEDVAQPNENGTRNRSEQEMKQPLEL